LPFFKLIHVEPYTYRYDNYYMMVYPQKELIWSNYESREYSFWNLPWSL
jgi:hypothetical protein